jgi:hypothetical protein
MSREAAPYVFQCSGAHGRWLALRGPVSLQADLVVESSAVLMDAVRGCREVSVWIDDERVLTLVRKSDAPRPRTAH